MTLMEIYNRFFLVNLNEFPNIGIDLEINKILFCFLIGIVVTTVIFNYRTTVNSTLIKKLMRHESKNAENAKTLDELGINNFGTRQALSSTGGRLTKLIVRIDENSVSTEKVDIENESNAENDLSQADDSESFCADKIADEQILHHSQFSTSLCIFCPLLIII